MQPCIIIICVTRDHMSHRPGAFHLGGLVTTTTAFSAAKRVTKNFPGIVNTVSNTFDAYQNKTDWSGNLTSRISVRCVLGPKNRINAILLRGVFFRGNRGRSVGRSVSLVARSAGVRRTLASFLFVPPSFTSLSIISRRGHPMSGGRFWNQITQFPGSLPS